MKNRFLLLGGVFGFAIVAASFNFKYAHVQATVPGANSLISPSYSSSSQTGNGTSVGSVLSANGKFVLFRSSATNIVSSDTNSKVDYFVRNIASGITTRVNVSTSGVQANDDVLLGTISSTGRYIAFTSKASNLIDGTTISSTNQQLYLRDTQTNTTTLLSQNSSGTIADSGIGKPYNISSDGRFVLFNTNATNLGPTVTNTGGNLYMLDRSSNTFSILNVKTDGTQPTNNFTPWGGMNCDGSLVVFQSGAHLVLSDPSPSHLDIYLLDLRSGNKLTNLSKGFNRAAGVPTISCNGDYIGFSSQAYNIDPILSTDPYPKYHYYSYNRTGGSYSLLDQSTAGTVGNSSTCDYNSTDCLAISDTGVATFTSPSTNLTSTTPSVTQIYLRNIEAATTEVVSQDSSGTYSNGANGLPKISSDGKLISYYSNATNLFTGTDTNGTSDIFLSETGL